MFPSTITAKSGGQWRAEALCENRVFFICQAARAKTIVEHLVFVSFGSKKRQTHRKGCLGTRLVRKKSHKKQCCCPAGIQRYRKTKSCAPAGLRKSRKKVVLRPRWDSKVSQNNGVAAPLGMGFKGLAKKMCCGPLGFKRLAKQRWCGFSGFQKSCKKRCWGPDDLYKSRRTTVLRPDGLQRRTNKQCCGPGGFQKSCKHVVAGPAGLQKSRNKNGVVALLAFKSFAKNNM